MFLIISRKSQTNICARASFLIKFHSLPPNFIKKETLALLFFCEFCEIFKNTFFTEHLLAKIKKKTKVSLIKKLIPLCLDWLNQTDICNWLVPCFSSYFAPMQKSFWIYSQQKFIHKRFIQKLNNLKSINFMEI